VAGMPGMVRARTSTLRHQEQHPECLCVTLCVTVTVTVCVPVSVSLGDVRMRSSANMTCVTSRTLELCVS
jgi:hypothetical protein